MHASRQIVKMSNSGQLLVNGTHMYALHSTTARVVLLYLTRQIKLHSKVTHFIKRFGRKYLKKKWQREVDLGCIWEIQPLR